MIDHVFLGGTCIGGIDPALRDRLVEVEASLRTVFAADPDPRDPLTGDSTTDFFVWCGIREPHGGFRQNAGLHTLGQALDINTTTNPYIATRSNADGTFVLGGEAGGASLQFERRQALAVLDKARVFLGLASPIADVSGRRPGEDTDLVYDRFREASDLLHGYLIFAIRSGPTRVQRTAIANSQSTSDDALLAAIPETERLALSDALPDLSDFMSSPEFAAQEHIIRDPEQQYFEMLRDYEAVRIPMAFGTPVPLPASTRNPANGFMDLRKELVLALCEVGNLRWGAADFGAFESGDMMHFDMAQRIFVSA